MKHTDNITHTPEGPFTGRRTKPEDIEQRIMDELGQIGHPDSHGDMIKQNKKVYDKFVRDVKTLVQTGKKMVKGKEEIKKFVKKGVETGHEMAVNKIEENRRKRDELLKALKDATKYAFLPKDEYDRLLQAIEAFVEQQEKRIEEIDATISDLADERKKRQGDKKAADEIRNRLAA